MTAFSFDPDLLVSDDVVELALSFFYVGTSAIKRAEFVKADPQLRERMRLALISAAPSLILAYLDAAIMK